MASGGGIHVQDMATSGSQAVAVGVVVENQATGGVDAGRLFPLALQQVPKEALYEVLAPALLRMSVVEVSRCGAISKRLCEIINIDAFRRNHHRHPLWYPMPLFFHRVDHKELLLEDLVRIHLRYVDIVAYESLSVIRFAHADPAIDSTSFRIEGSCDGILLLSYHARLYTYNPTMRH